MKEKDQIIVKWGQEDVETSKNLLNNNNNFGKVYPFRLRRYSPFWALAAPRRRLYSSPSSAYLLFWKSDAN